MRLICDPGVDGIGTMTPADAGEGASPEPSDRGAVARFLSRDDVKGAILRLDCRGAGCASLSVALAQPGLLDEISGATVPVVASIRGSCAGPMQDLADACHFRVAEPGEEDAAARALLEPMVAGRPARLVRAVVESTGNAWRMKESDALARETEIFMRVACAGRRTIRSRVASARVVARGELAAAMASSPLSPAEAEALGRRHPQSLAGAIAAKEAIAGLLSEMRPGPAVRPEEIVLSHDGEGAPVIEGLPGGIDPGARIFVSITHTGETAWAVAAVETETGP